MGDFTTTIIVAVIIGLITWKILILITPRWSVSTSCSITTTSLTLNKYYENQ